MGVRTSKISMCAVPFHIRASWRPGVQDPIPWRPGVLASWRVDWGLTVDLPHGTMELLSEYSLLRSFSVGGSGNVNSRIGKDCKMQNAQRVTDWIVLYPYQIPIGRFGYKRVRAQFKPNRHSQKADLKMSENEARQKMITELMANAQYLTVQDCEEFSTDMLLALVDAFSISDYDYSNN